MKLLPEVTTALIVAWTAISPLRAVGEVSDGAMSLRVEQRSGQLVIARDNLLVATYVYRDEEIHRPFYANVHVPSGLPITRQHPPRPGTDAVDHATMHPGIWLAFGDISGRDFWRNRDRVEHVGFVQPPEANMDGQDGVVTFAVRNRYVAGDKTVCQELARHTIRATGNGYLFMLDSEFSGEQAFTFGDQEEMGLGVRVATPINVRGGTGIIATSNGDKNEKQVWGKQTEWCDYSGIVAANANVASKDGKLLIGLLLVPHPHNFRRSWMHARDYGLVVANPFGQQAFTKGTPSRVEVKTGEILRLRFGIWAYATKSDDRPNRDRMANEYLRLADER
jgi:hypothetical protein